MLPNRLERREINGKQSGLVNRLRQTRKRTAAAPDALANLPQQRPSPLDNAPPLFSSSGPPATLLPFNAELVRQKSGAAFASRAWPATEGSDPNSLRSGGVSVLDPGDFRQQPSGSGSSAKQPPGGSSSAKQPPGGGSSAKHLEMLLQPVLTSALHGKE